MKRWIGLFVVGVVGALVCWASVAGAWPNDPEADPKADPPNDPGYIQFNDEGQVTGGQWNLWSFVPEIWQQTTNFREAEIALGTGMHADRAWQRTTGRTEVVIAVLDSGVRWGRPDLINQFYINAGELDAHRPAVPDDYEGDPFDVNGDGVFNIKDYSHFFPDAETARLDGAPGNQNGRLDPQDLIRHFSDGTDDDNNGYIDDISGWDFFWNDNDPHDDTDFGHGDGEAHDSAAEGDNGIGDLGVCPGCRVLMCRAGDSFVVDANDFAGAVTFAVDSGASVIQEALGSINNTTFSQEAIEYAYQNNVVVIASAADELSFHHNFPGTNNHTVYVHAVVHDEGNRDDSTTFLNYNNCTNHGGQLLLSTPGGGCSSEATGKTAGHAGIMYSAALDAALDPPITAEEIRGVMIMSSDDIDVPESRQGGREGMPCTEADADEVCGRDGLFRCFLPSQNRENPGAPPVGECFNTKFPSGPGWDFHFGYGRNNVRKSVDMILDGRIPPEVDIAHPLWFETVDPAKTPTVEIQGRVGARVDGQPARYAEYNYEVEFALGADPKGGWTLIDQGTTESLDGTIATFDLTSLPDGFDYTNPPTEAHEDAVTLRVRVTAMAVGGVVESEFRKTIFVHTDDSLMEGYPMFVGASGESSPKFYDIDADGKDELIYITSDGTLNVFNEDTSQVPGFPLNLGRKLGYDDDRPGSHRNACAFREDKTGCKAQRYTISPDIYETLIGSPAIGDVDKDGDPEIVVSTFDGRLYVYHHDGSMADGFPVSTDYERSADARSPDPQVGKRNTMDHGFFSSPVLYDLDGDGDLEIINAAMDQHLYVWDHDGSTHEGFPVLCRDVEDGNRGFRIVVSPAIGDLDLDGEPEMVLGTNEYYDESVSRMYIVRAKGNADPEGPFELGGPIYNFGLVGEVLPMVGEGSPSNPAIADVDFDGRPEFAIEAIAGLPIMYQLNPEESPFELKKISRADNITFGPGSNSLDSPAYPLVNNGSFGKVDPSGDIAYVKGTAGFNFAFAFAEGGTRLVFDHHVSAWNMNPASQVNGAQPFIEGFPQVVEDWQFFMNPALVDLTGDGLSEIVVGTGGYLLRAMDYTGAEAPGFPKHTGGWIIPSPAVGDIDGDGTFEIASATRNGNLYIWKTGAPTTNRLDWQNFGHDSANTSNYHTPLFDYRGGANNGNNGANNGENNGNNGGNNGNNGGNNGNNGGNNGANNGEPPAASTDDDGGCCRVAPASPTSAPVVMVVLGLIGLLVLRRRS